MKKFVLYYLAVALSAVAVVGGIAYSNAKKIEETNPEKYAYMKENFGREHAPYENVVMTCDMLGEREVNWALAQAAVRISARVADEGNLLRATGQKVFTRAQPKFMVLNHAFTGMTKDEAEFLVVAGEITVQAEHRPAVNQAECELGVQVTTALPDSQSHAMTVQLSAVRAGDGSWKTTGQAVPSRRFQEEVRDLTHALSFANALDSFRGFDLFLNPQSAKELAGVIRGRFGLDCGAVPFDGCSSK